MELTFVSIDAFVSLANQKNKMVFSTEVLALIKVLHQEKGYDN